MYTKLTLALITAQESWTVHRLFAIAQDQSRSSHVHGKYFCSLVP